MADRSKGSAAGKATSSRGKRTDKKIHPASSSAAASTSSHGAADLPDVQHRSGDAHKDGDGSKSMQHSQLHDSAAAAAAEEEGAAAADPIAVLEKFIETADSQDIDVSLLKYALDRCKPDIRAVLDNVKVTDTTPDQHKKTALDHVREACRLMKALIMSKDALYQPVVQHQQQPPGEQQQPRRMHRQQQQQQGPSEVAVNRQQRGMQRDQQQYATEVDWGWRKSQSESIWEKLGEYLAYLCLVVSSGYLSAAVVSEEIKTLNGLDWLFDSQRGVWCGLQEKPLIVDVVDLDLPLSELCAAAPMPLIFVRSVVQYEGKSLDYVSNKKQSTVPSGKILMELFNRLGLTTLTQARTLVPHYEDETVLPDKKDRDMKLILRVTSRFLAGQIFPPMLATYITEKLSRITQHLQIKTVNNLKVQFMVPHTANIEPPNANPGQLTPLGNLQSPTAVLVRPNAESEQTTLLLSRTVISNRLQVEQLQRNIAGDLARIVMDGSPCASDDPFVFADALMRQVSHVLVGFVLAPSPGVRVHPSSCRVRIQAPSARVPMHPPPATLSPSDRSKVVAGRLILLAERYLGRAVKEGEYAIGGRQYLIKSQEVMAGDLNVHELFRLFAWKGPGGPTLNVSGYSAFEALSDMFATPAASPFPLIYMEADFMGPVAAAFMGLLRRPKDDQVGKVGEILVTNIMQAVVPRLGGVMANLEDIRPTGGPYDIKITFPSFEKTIFFEVKTTDKRAYQPHAHSFEVSQPQFRQAQRLGGSLGIARVYGAPSSRNKIHQIGVLFCLNPILLNENRILEITHEMTSLVTRKTMVNVGPGL